MLNATMHCVMGINQVTVLERIGKERAGPGRTYAFKSLLEVRVHQHMHLSLHLGC